MPAPRTALTIFRSAPLSLLAKWSQDGSRQRQDPIEGLVGDDSLHLFPMIRQATFMVMVRLFARSYVVCCVRVEQN